MANLVVIAGTITSKLITTLAFVDRLRQEGHRVTVHIPPGDALTSHPVDADLVDLRVLPPTWTPPTAAAVSGFQDQLRDADADLYLMDTEANEYILAALAAGLPVALINVFFNLWKLPGVPPVHQDVIPGRGLRGSRLGIEYGWAGYRAFRLRAVARSMLLKDDQRHHLLAFARSLGVDPRATVTEFHGLLPFMYRTLKTLTLNMEELEFPGATHPLNRYVGAMPNVTRTDLPSQDEEQRVASDIEEFSAQFPDRKLVYCGFGAYYQGDDVQVWRRAIEAIGSRPDWIGVFGLGRRIKPEDLAPLPENVRVYPWAPQLQILEQADCAVIHGGMTSVYECLHHQVPMVVLPIGDSFDQFGTGCRVGYHRLGVLGDRTTVTAGQLVQMISTAMTDADIRSRLRRFSDDMSRYRTDRVLTTAVEALIADQTF